MTEILITSEALVKALINISDNVSPKFIQPAIREAQEVRLRGILGDALLNKLKDVVADGTPYPEPYATLLARCQYVVAYTAVARVIPKVTYKIGNFGLVKSSDTNQQAVTSQEMDKMVEAYTNDADRCALGLQQYLLQNKVLFPELTETQCNGIRANLYSSASCGVWLGGSRGRIMRRVRR